MPSYSTAVREEKTEEVVELRSKQLSFRRIAKRLGIAGNTAKKWYEDEISRRSEHRSHDKERHLAVYDAIQSEAWEQYEQAEPGSKARGTFLNTVKNAEDSKVKITGAEAPVKHEHKDTTEYEVTWDDVGDIEAESEWESSELTTSGTP